MRHPFCFVLVTLVRCQFVESDAMAISSACVAQNLSATSVQTTSQCKDATMLGLVMSPTGHRRDTAAFIIRQLAAAQCSILVMQSALEYQPIIDVLHLRQAAGVNVTVLVDNTVMGSDAKSRLRKSNRLHLSDLNQSLGMRSNGDGGLWRSSGKHKSFLFHHKTLIIDDQIVCLGSANLFEEALLSFDEDYACFCNELLSKRFAAFFRHRWHARGWRVPGPTSAGRDAAVRECSLHTTLTPNQFPSSHSPRCNSLEPCHKYYSLATVQSSAALALACVGERAELLEGPFFGPECQIDDVWMRYIHMARRRIRLAHYKVAWSPLIDSLAHAAARGVDVSVFTGTIAYAGHLNMSSLAHNIQWHQFRPAKQGATSEFNTGSQLFHHKIMLIDEDIVLIGSCNAMATSIRADSEDLTVFKSNCMSKRVDTMCETHTQFERAEMVMCIDSRPRRGGLMKSVVSSFSTRQAKLQLPRDPMAVAICSNGSL